MKGESIMRKTVVLITLFFICLILGQASLGFGQKFPTKPIRYIVPFAAGGGTDIVARLIAKPMEKELGQKIFVENMPGGSTKVGTMALMEAKPDGYTIMQASELTWLGGYYSKLFDSKVWEKLTPLANIALEPFGFYFVRTESPFKTWADLVKFAKENPGKLTCGITSRGAYDIMGEDVAKSFGIQPLKRVPFTGGGPAIVALLGGHIDLHMGIASEAMPMLLAGKVRGLAFQTDKRQPLLPNVPTFKEMGHEVIKVTATRSIWGPPNMPNNIIDIYSRAIEKSTKDPEFVKPVEETFVHTVEFRPGSKMLDAVREFDKQIGPRLAEFSK
jgi:tripartite-type tricarboxylate transporter receptor subunit TctC